jgi:hypothetical protein
MTITAETAGTTADTVFTFSPSESISGGAPDFRAS